MQAEGSAESFLQRRSSRLLLFAQGTSQSSLSWTLSRRKDSAGSGINCMEFCPESSTSLPEFPSWEPHLGPEGSLRCLHLKWWGRTWRQGKSFKKRLKNNNNKPPKLWLLLLSSAFFGNPYCLQNSVHIP